MDRITRYRSNVDEAMKKVKNNIDYFDSFGDVYVTQKFKEYLDNIYGEMEKVRLIVLAKEDELVEKKVEEETVVEETKPVVETKTEEPQPTVEVKPTEEKQPEVTSQ